jgi:two-component system, OmpR family, response regulator
VRVLVVEDDPRVSSLLRRSLEREGDAVDVACSGQDALWMATETEYAIVVLDVMIPPPDGFVVCRRLREGERWMPILLLTAKGDVEDRVMGLDAGADDYLAKPFSLREFHARVRALVRRKRIERPTVVQVDDITLDPATRAVMRAGVAVQLSPKEFALLELFLRRPSEVLSRGVILEHVWDFAYEGVSNVVDVYVRYLRDKLDRPFNRASFETVRGVGYRLQAGA